MNQDPEKETFGAADPQGGDRSIIRSPRGSARRVVALEDVVVPDLWHLHLILKKLAAQLEVEDADEEAIEKPLSDALADLEVSNWPGPWQKASDDVLECWHLCHDLLANLKGEV